MIYGFFQWGSAEKSAEEIGCSPEEVRTALKRFPAEAREAEVALKQPAYTPPSEPDVELPEGAEPTPRIPTLAIPKGLPPAVAMIKCLELGKTALLRARTFMEAKQVKDFATATAAYARGQHLAEELIAEAVHLRVECFTKMALLWEQEPKNPGTRMAGKIPGNIGGVRRTPPMIPTLEDHGLDKNEMKTARGLLALAREEPALYQEVLTGRKTIHGALRGQWRDGNGHGHSIRGGLTPPPSVARPTHQRLLDAIMARGCLQVLTTLPELATEREVQTGAANAVLKLDALVIEIVSRAPMATVLLDEIQGRDSGLEKLVAFTRARISKKA